MLDNKSYYDPPIKKGSWLIPAVIYGIVFCMFMSIAVSIRCNSGKIKAQKELTNGFH